MVISVRELFSLGGLFEFLVLIYTSKQRKRKKYAVHEAPTIDEIDQLVGLNILPANVIENLLPPRYKQQQENSDKLTSQPEARITRVTILVPKNENRAVLCWLRCRGDLEI